MLLKSIEIQGFKSFADKTVLNFGEGITAVVGPNGSGKSNISDAVRWVLGEQSTKTLRGLKMEDVIFGGTAGRKPLGFAEVTLTIDNKDRNIQCDSDEVSVTRRYYRSGDSEYRINRASVRLKDVHELFMDTGLGRDGYSMVGQGKIDDIVGTKTSSERREIFEEAAGISRYRYRKLEAERKLKQTEENLVRLRDILSELELRVIPLAEQSKKAQKFIEYENEKRDLEIGLWLISIDKYKENLRQQEHKITAVRAQYESANDLTADIDKEIEQLADESQRIIIEIDEIRRSAAELDESAAKIEGDIAVNDNTVYHNNETISRIMRELEGMDKSDLLVEEEIKEKKAQSDERSAHRAELKDKLSSVQQDLLNIAGESDVFSKQIEQLTMRLNALSAKSSDERVRMMTARSTVSEIESRAATVDELIADKKSAVESLNTELSQLDKDLARCDSVIEECTNSLNGREMIISSRRTKCEDMKNEIDRLTLDKNENIRRAQILEDLEKNMEGFSFAVKSVINASSSGNLRGIHGAVSRIFTVDKDYSVAIEAALGASVQNIVTGNEEDAKRAINYLKTNRSGRVTFLPLTSIKGRVFRESGVENCVGFVGMASTLVKYDKKFENIISYLLGSVVVAEDIDSAVSISKKFGYRFKTVTLDGQIVNAGGSLTGGSVSKNSGLLSRASDISDLRKKAEAIEKQISDKNAILAKAKEELGRLESEILSAKGELTTAQEDKIRVLGEIKRIGEQLEIQKTDTASLNSEKLDLSLRKENLLKEIADAQAEEEKISAETAEIESNIMSITGGRDRTAAKREELSAVAAQLGTEIFAAQKDIEMLDHIINELSQRVSGQSERKSELIAEMEHIKADNAGIEEKNVLLRQKVEQIRAESQSAGLKVERCSTRRNELEQKVGALRLEHRDKLDERERLNAEIVRLEERKITMVREYDDSIKRMYDEYQLTRREAEELGIVIENVPESNKRLIEIKSKIRSLGNVNVSAIEEYKEVKERYDFLNEQVGDVENSRDELYKLINKLTGQMKNLFVERFDEINRHFSKVFVELFGGGTAELKLNDPDNVLESGIEIIVQPPGKNISIIEQLSGGEKALIAISIYFAVMKVNPPPFCILDEVDAALDDVNITRFADYLRKMSTDSQFIVITHRRGTMEEADMLYGVTMQEKGISKLLELNVAEIERQMNL